MDVLVNSTKLRLALARVLTILEKKSVVRPILSYTLFDISDNTIEIQATDMEVAVRITIQAEVEKKGRFCINARSFFDALRGFPDDQVKMKLCENSLQIESENIYYSLLVYESDEYPNLLFQHSDAILQISNDKMLDIISKTSHSISHDETRVHLNGIFFSEYNGQFRSVSTDGHRFAMIDTEVENFNPDILGDGIIVPKKGVFELKRMVENNENSSISLSVDDTFLYVSAGSDYFLSIRLIARHYPNYHNVIPQNPVRHFFVDKIVFLDAVKRVKIMSNEKSHGIIIKLMPSSMKITANDPSLGDAYERIPIKYEEEAMEIGFNANYLIDSLSIFEDGDVEFQFNNDIMPVIVKPVVRSDYLTIIMPLKL